MAAELALGSLVLAGLFSITLEVWEFFDAGLSHAQSFSRLQTKLGNQKLEFEIWATQLGFGSDNSYDCRLDSEAIRPTLERNLNEILRLFTDATSMVRKYGIKAQHPENISGSGAVQSPWKRLFHSQYYRGKILRVIQWEGVAASMAVGTGAQQGPIGSKTPFEMFLEATRQHQKRTTLWRLITWAVKDERKFDGMVRDLGDLIGSLKSITRELLPHQGKQQPTRQTPGACFANGKSIEIGETKDILDDILPNETTWRFAAIESSSTKTGAMTMTTFITSRTHQSEISAWLTVQEPNRPKVQEESASCEARAAELGRWDAVRRQNQFTAMSKDYRYSGSGWAFDQSVLDATAWEGIVFGPVNSPYNGGIFSVVFGTHPVRVQITTRLGLNMHDAYHFYGLFDEYGKFYISGLNLGDRGQNDRAVCEQVGEFVRSSLIKAGEKLSASPFPQQDWATIEKYTRQFATGNGV